MFNRFPPQRSDAGQRNVTAVVKWYNPTKGFGFVQPTDGSADAFLHASVLAQAGQQVLTEGMTIVCDVAEGQRGPQVTALHSVQPGSGAPAPRSSGGMGMGRGGGGMGMGMGGGGGMGPAGAPMEGTVKFYSAEKGFGFVAPDDGGRDVFVSARTLQRAGIASLESDQRVRLTVRMGQKGPMAERVDLI